MRMGCRGLLAFALLAGASTGCIINVETTPEAMEMMQNTSSRERSYVCAVAATASAVRDAIQAMDLPLNMDSEDSLGARIETLSADGSEIAFFVSRKGDSATSLRVRVRGPASEDTAKLMLARIDEHLPAGAAESKRAVHMELSLSR